MKMEPANLWWIDLIEEKITPEFFGRLDKTKEEVLQELFSLINQTKIVVYADKKNNAVFLLMPEGSSAEVHIIAKTKNILTASSKFLDWALKEYNFLIMKTKNPKMISLVERFKWKYLGKYKGASCYILGNYHGWCCRFSR